MKQLLSTLCYGEAIDGHRGRYLPTGEFRQPEEGEVFLSDGGASVIEEGLTVHGPRIILRAVPFSSQKKQGIVQAVESIRIGLDVIMRELR